VGGQDEDAVAAVPETIFLVLAVGRDAAAGGGGVRVGRGAGAAGCALPQGQCERCLGYKRFREDVQWRHRVSSGFTLQ